MSGETPSRDLQSFKILLILEEFCLLQTAISMTKPSDCHIKKQNFILHSPKTSVECTLSNDFPDRLKNEMNVASILFELFSGEMYADKCLVNSFFVNFLVVLKKTVQCLYVVDVYWALSWFKHVLHGCGEPTGCPLAWWWRAWRGWRTSWCLRRDRRGRPPKLPAKP